MMMPTSYERLPNAAYAFGDEDQLSAWVLGAYMFLKMFVITRSGLPQPADLMIVALSPWVIRAETVRTLLYKHPLTLLFTIWVILVSATWAAISSNAKFLIFGSYYIFNLIVLALGYQAWMGPRILAAKIIGTTIVCSAMLQLATSLVTPGIRETGTFNNPNQLAYWAVCCTCIYLLVRQRELRLIDFAVTGAIAYLCLESLSRAGLISVAVMLGIGVLRSAGRSAKGNLIAGAAAILLLGVTVAGGSQLFNRLTVVERLEERLVQRSGANELDNRNYDRLLAHPDYLAFGAGEGDYSRFDEGDRAIEIHSTVANLLFSYGLVGLALFLGLIGTVIYRTSRESLLFLLPLLLYGLTHNGIRFSFAWILVGLLMGSEGAARATQVWHRRPSRHGVW